MSSKERKEQEKLELRKKILEAAKEILFEKGLDNLTMRAIGEKIDYSPTTIYLYFKNKAELTTSLMEYAFEQLVEALGGLDQSLYVDNPIGMLKEGLCVYIRHGAANPHFYRMMTTSVLNHNDSSITLKKGTMNEQAFGILAMGVQNCIDAGVVEVKDSKSTAAMLWAAIHGLTMILIDVPHFPLGDKDKFITAYTDMLVNKL